MLLFSAHRLPAPIVEEEKPTPTPPPQKKELPKAKHSTSSKEAANKPETRAKPASPPRLQGTGRLVISRAPNFGWNVAVHLQIDGRDVANITQGGRYDGVVPTGHHVLTVAAGPATPPTSIDLDVQPGRTYTFTAVWTSDLVALRPSR